MKIQFFRLYAFAVISLIAVLSASAQLYRHYTPDHNAQLTFNVQDLVTLAQQKETRIVAVSNSDFEVAPSIAQRLARESMINVQMGDAYYIYIRDEDTGQVFQLGPLDSVTKPESEGNFFLLVYSLIALLMLVLVWPLFKDLNKLKKATYRFAASRKEFAPPVSQRSSIYPLAQSMSDMSAQIARFVSLHEDLSRIISHEIRTPLSRMRFAVSLASDLDPETLSSLNRNIDAVEKHLDQYLGFARVEHLSLPLKQTAVDSVKLIEQVAAEFTHYPQVCIEHQINHEQLLCEPQSFEILLQNLIGNACKYADSQVNIRFSKQGDQQVLEVFDDGSGLPKDADALITPFKQGDDAPLASGYGLGLYIVYRITQWHGGAITLKNHPDTQGAHIIVRWPNR